MPRRALLYDIHGNLGALEAVLRDARSLACEQVLLGGDYALFGPHPAETVAALRELAAASWIRGNVDRWTANPGSAPDDELIKAAIEACREALGEQSVNELAGLPEQEIIDGTRFCHASPHSDLRSFMPEPTDDEEELLAGAPERRIVFGHTHLQFTRRTADGIELVNPGSVGMPLDGDRRAAYAVLEAPGAISLRRVEYDYERSARAMKERFGDAQWAQRSARRIRSARL